MLVLGLSGAVRADTSDYAREIAHVREQREAGLRQPLGWLSLVGLHWLSPGSQRVGSAPDNDIVLAVGPLHLGQVSVDADGVVRLAPAAGADFFVDGKPVGEAAFVLQPDTRGQATEVTFDGGSSGFNLIDRSGRLGLRVRDSKADTLRNFTGLSYFPADPSWRVEARFEPHPIGSTIEIANVLNQLQSMPNPGAVVFERGGHTHRLEAIANGDGSLFLIFADRTSGKHTYGAGRFLDTPPPQDGSVVVDFNRAYNPPCAFNAYSTCPLPPPENRLDLEVTAGEKRYDGLH